MAEAEPYERSGIIGYRFVEERLELLVTALMGQTGSTLDDLAVSFPAGHVEEGETNEQAAVREAEEEAGIRGTIRKYLGASVTEKPGANTHVYVLEVEQVLSEDDYMEGKKRKRFWVLPSQFDTINWRNEESKAIM
jgi:8-oxo-dGTP pyrophosphatase MutT (NUDIX family)